MPLNLQIHLRLINEYFKRLLECGGDGCCLAGLEEKDGLLANVEVDEADLHGEKTRSLGRVSSERQKRVCSRKTR